MIEPHNYGALLQAGQGLVPDLAAHDLRQQAIDINRQQVGAQQMAAQAEMAQQQRQEQGEAEYQAAFQEYLRNPTLQGLTGLMGRFPQMSEALKRAHDAQDEGRRQADFRDLGQLHDALRSGRNDLALRLIDRRIAADRAAGREVDPVDQQVRDAIASGDPQQIAYAGDTARRLTALVAGPEQFRSVYETDDPRFRNVGPGDTLFEERSGRVAQSPNPQIISGPGGIYEQPLAPNIPVLGTGRPPAAVDPAPAPAQAPTQATAWSAISVPGQPRDGGRRRHAGYDMASANPEWRPAQPFRIANVRNGPRQGITADVIFEDGTRVVAMHLRDRPQPGRYPAGALAGIAGNTGNARSTPAHIHAEAWRNGRRVDPRPYFGGPSDPPRVRSRQQYARLASGSEYIAPDGSRRRKP